MVLTRVIADAVVIAIVLFVVRTASAVAVFRVNPALLRERATVLRLLPGFWERAAK
ncbi:MAG: hypothetical protein ABIT20_19730 [Gemmatimonadaceae bacterium]